MTEYKEFLASKKTLHTSEARLSVDSSEVRPELFDFQRDIVMWALKKGKAAIFASTGLGKTAMQVSWADLVVAKTGGKVLIVAPLAVSKQTVKEAAKFGVKVTFIRENASVVDGINITNYEMAENIDAAQFSGVVLDESSILKSHNSQYRIRMTEAFEQTPFKLCCTATPAPNDHVELGNHAEFLGVMSQTEMLASFFTHDGANTSKWRLKKHATSKFWDWVASWAVMISKPSDLGYKGHEGYNLPPLNLHQVSAASDYPILDTMTLVERREARRSGIEEKCRIAAEIINASSQQWLVWCDLNDESAMLSSLINQAVEIKGSDTPKHKILSMEGFENGSIKVLVTKPKIAGFGMNWQHCRNMIFVGLSDSFEAYFQAVRRCWRFGQTKPVDVYLITSPAEGAVVENVKRKEADYITMLQGMIAATQDITHLNIQATRREADMYTEDKIATENYTLYNGDSCEVIKQIPDKSIDFSVFSPPFSSLYTYSNSERDMGNCRDDDEFYKHFRFLSTEILRILKPGRLVAIHCMNLPTSKQRDGVIGLKDFRGDIIKLFQDAGFIYHSEVCIWKDPVVAVVRTKALGLLHKTIRKDSAMSRQGIADYLVTFRAPGVNENPIAHNYDNFPVNLWQRYASPVWMDINATNTLQYQSARDNDDEKHICPLQLDVIERALVLWTNPGDTVFSPFAGIGSEGFVSIQMGRKFVGVELKQSYFKAAANNLDLIDRYTTENGADFYPNPFLDDEGKTSSPTRTATPKASRDFLKPTGTRKPRKRKEPNEIVEVDAADCES